MKNGFHFFLIFFCIAQSFATTDPLQPFLDSLDEQSQINTIQSEEFEQLELQDEITKVEEENSKKDEPNLTTEAMIPTEPLATQNPHQEPLQSVIENQELGETLATEGRNGIQSESQSKEVLEPVYKKIDLPYSEHSLIDWHRAEYMTNFGKQRLADIMQRALPYRPHIRQTLQEEEIPLSLEFLPVIESDFRTTAVSRSGATGIWQFMENSIAGLLEKNEWIDERHDPWLSTEAAAQKLKYNYSILKSWELALAAYNMGLGGLQRAINNAGSNDFWYLAENGYIPNQTRNYVPKFIAVADLVTNAEYYGLSIPEYDENAAIDFIEIQVNKQINLEVLATLTNIDYSTYQFLNPGFEYAITPPNDYMLRIPSESEAIILEAIEKQDSTSFLESHRVAQGDTLWSLSQKYNTTVEILCEINNRNPNAILSIGTILFLPILK